MCPFQVVERNDILNEIRSLNTTKSTEESDISSKIYQIKWRVIANFVHAAFSGCLESWDLVSLLKWGNVTLIFKKTITTQHIKTIQKTVIQAVVFIFRQYFFDVPVKRLGFNPHHCLVAMVENWKTNTDTGKSFGALLTDLLTLSFQSVSVCFHLIFILWYLIFVQYLLCNKWHSFQTEI